MSSDPSDICYSAASNEAYCADFLNLYVAVIDGVTNRETYDVPVDAQPLFLCSDSANNKVLVSCLIQDQVLVIDCSTHRTIQTISVSNPEGMLYSPSGGLVYCASGEGIAVLDVAAGAVIGSLPAPSYREAMTLSPSLGRIYVAGPDASCVSVIRDSTVGCREEPSTRHLAAGVRAVTGSRASFLCSSKGAVLDIAGRVVAALHPGRNDLSRLARGVYVIKTDADCTPAKLVVID